ncbi:hypothetical protein XENTR_v10004935 [Xenopus tropicalis]|nr:hypothetical protein XENTR_v10004935 [Xenopus tropicalis]
MRLVAGIQCVASYYSRGLTLGVAVQQLLEYHLLTAPIWGGKREIIACLLLRISASSCHHALSIWHGTTVSSCLAM